MGFVLVVLLASVILAVPLRAEDVVATTNSTVGDGCTSVQSIYSGTVHFCNLNANHSCHDNWVTAFQGCILYVGGPCVFVVILAIFYAICMYCWVRKKRRSQYRASEEEQSLLEDQDNGGTQSTSTPTNTSDSIEKQSDSSSAAMPTSPPVNMSVKKKDTGNQLYSVVKNPMKKRSVSSSEVPGKTTEMLSVVRNVERRPRTLSNIERNRKRENDMYIEKAKTDKISEKMFEHKPGTFKVLPDLGSRLQKYWYKMERKKEGKVWQSTAKASRQCSLTLGDPDEMEMLRLLFEHIKHPHLLAVHGITYTEDNVGILLQYVKDGSIRDYLFKCSPDKNWDVKYNADGGSRSFSVEEIAKCGHQVLKAVEVLYDIGFSHIGQIHSGNVFRIFGDYVLGGYENSLLGYRTNMYQNINHQGLLDKIDIIMFGHLIYEMCTGLPLINVMPKASDYEKVQNSELREVIEFVFDTAIEADSPKNLMQLISLHRFFQSVASVKKPARINPIELPADVAKLIFKVFPAGLKLETIIKVLNGKYERELLLPKLGWRHGKLWAKARHTELQVEGLLTALVVPMTCPIFVGPNISTIRKILLLKHDFLFNIRDIDYREIDGQHVIVIFQDFVEKGSLRDCIYQVPPTTTWASKYMTKGIKLKPEQVALYGTQILQAMSHLCHLDKKESPLTLGYVHTGNIFVEGDTCRLGGFENTLLGYQPRRLSMLEEYLSNVDAYMLGHVIFEMSTGRELLTAVPKVEDFREVPKELHQVLQYIFGADTVNFEMITEMLQEITTFPSGVEIVDEVAPSGREVKSLDQKALFVLEKVRKGKQRDQDSKFEKGKHLVQAQFRILKKKIVS